MTKKFDYIQFAQDMCERFIAEIPQEFSGEEKNYVQNTVLNFPCMAGEALCEDYSINFNSKQLEFAVEVIAEWSFHKA